MPGERYGAGEEVAVRGSERALYGRGFGWAERNGDPRRARQALRKMDKSVAAFGSKQHNLWNVHPR